MILTTSMSLFTCFGDLLDDIVRPVATMKVLCVRAVASSVGATVSDSMLASRAPRETSPTPDSAPASFSIRMDRANVAHYDPPRESSR